VRRQQLAEEILARDLWPLDRVHAGVQRLHQRRQRDQESLALRRRTLRLHAHQQVAPGQTQTRHRRTVVPFVERNLHHRLTPHRRDEVAQEVRRRHILQPVAQLRGIALLQAQLVLLVRQHLVGLALALHVLPVLVDDELLERFELLLIELDLVEVAFDDLLHQLLDQLEERLAVLAVEIVERHAQRRDAVDESPHRVPARREERGVSERRAQYRQLQAADLACHLRWHLGVRQNLIEQTADHVDHHVIERAGCSLAQLVAVRDDQVGAGQAAGTGVQAADRAP